MDKVYIYLFIYYVLVSLSYIIHYIYLFFSLRRGGGEIYGGRNGGQIYNICSTI